MSFKLIAITPLAKCAEKFRKKLPVSIPNIFYNEYSVTVSSDGNSIERITKPLHQVPDELFYLENGIKLTVSAVVGKNGSGKSTIFELFFYTIYSIYTKAKLNGERILKNESEELRKRYNYALEKFQEIEELEKDMIAHATEQNTFLEDKIKIIHDYIIENNIELDSDDYKSQLKLIKSVLRRGKFNLAGRLTEIEMEEENELEIRNGLAVSIVYESDGIIQEIMFDRGNFSYSTFQPNRKEITSDITTFEASNFFYSICVNYSLHGLNSKSIGNWINRLFHKNDAYKTPIVINPMRHDGVFDINHELHLLRERLMANILFDLIKSEKTTLLGKYNIKEFVFSVKIKSSPLVHPYDISSMKIYHLLKENGIDNSKDLPFWDFAISYMEYKVRKIERSYDSVIKNMYPNLKKDERLKKFLIEDNSHITKKVRQTLNFLKQTSEKSTSFWGGLGKVTKTLSTNQMKQWIELQHSDPSSLKPSELLEYGLPGFFYIDFVLTRDDSNDILFSQLSSGEQQMVLNMNSILYHLYNLQSVHQKSSQTKKLSNTGRILYKNINVILDEIELYYHPEMQRRLISELVANFEKIKHSDGIGIQSINVCILTHSPFILSDVPKQNVLSLTESKESQLVEQHSTFGGNIHEILMGTFFMDSTLGAQTINTIQKLIDLYDLARRAVDNQDIDDLKIKFNKLRQLYEFTVENLGEDVLREVLKNNLEYIKFIIEATDEKN